MPPRPNFQHKLLGLFYLMSFPLLTRFSMSRPHSGHSQECHPQTALQKGHLQRQSSFDKIRSEINVDLKNAANISNITITNRISAMPKPYATSPEFPAKAPSGEGTKKGTEVPRVYVVCARTAQTPKATARRWLCGCVAVRV